MARCHWLGAIYPGYVEPPRLDRGRAADHLADEPVRHVEPRHAADAGRSERDVAVRYTTTGGSITQTDVTDPRGHVERLAFNADHYMTSDTEAYGTSLARTTTITRQAGSNFLTAVVDPLSRRTEYTYDTSGHVLTRRRSPARPMR